MEELFRLTGYLAPQDVELIQPVTAVSGFMYLLYRPEQHPSILYYIKYGGIPKDFKIK